MAMIRCSECNADISDKAKSCPKCGCPIMGTGIEVVPSPILPVLGVDEGRTEKANDEASGDPQKQKETALKKGCSIGCSVISGLLILLFLIGLFSNDTKTDIKKENERKTELVEKVQGVLKKANTLIDASDCKAALNVLEAATDTAAKIKDEGIKSRFNDLLEDCRAFLSDQTIEEELGDLSNAELVDIIEKGTLVASKVRAYFPLQPQLDRLFLDRLKKSKEKAFLVMQKKFIGDMSDSAIEKYITQGICQTENFFHDPKQNQLFVEQLNEKKKDAKKIRDEYFSMQRGQPPAGNYAGALVGLFIWHKYPDRRDDRITQAYQDTICALGPIKAEGKFWTSSVQFRVKNSSGNYDVEVGNVKWQRGCIRSIELNGTPIWPPTKSESKSK